MRNRTRNKTPKLHLLRSFATPHVTPLPSPATLQKPLEERISKLEKELRKSIRLLQSELKKNKKQKKDNDSPKMIRELAKLTRILSQKQPHSGVEGEAHEALLREGATRAPVIDKPTTTPPKASYFKVLNHYLQRAFSLRTYRRMWFGVTRLEKEEFDEFGRDPAFEKKLMPFFDFLYYKYWRVSVEGIENIPAKGKALIVANHSGTLPFDGSMIRTAVNNESHSQRDVRFLVEDFVYYLPFLGTWMYRIGGVRAAPDNAERLLRKNHLVTVFPEGEKGIGKSYKQRYHLQRFGRGGFIKLILKTGAPIIPCAVIGAEETHPLLYRTSFLAKPFGIPYVPITPTLPWLGPLGLIGLPAKWTIIFGKPIDLSEYGPEAIEDELLVHRLSEKVRQTIQEMIREGLKKRRSVWFG